MLVSETSVIGVYKHLPIKNTNSEEVLKPALMHGLREADRHFGRWVYLGAKSGGKHDGGVLGGVFISSDQKLKALFKHEKNASKVLGEFLAGQLWEAATPEYSARTFLSTHNKKVRLPDIGGKNVYLGSLWIEGYKELYLDIEEQRKKEGLPMPSWWPHANGKITFGKFLDQLTGFYSHAFSAYEYDGFPQVMATSLLLADFGVHSANVGVVREKGKRPKLMRIDFGSSFKGIDAKEIHPNSRSRHLPLFQKGGGFSSNYFASYPQSAKITSEFAAELDRVAAFDFSEKIHESLQYANNFFDRKVFQKFGKRIGMPREQLHDIEKTEISKNIAGFLTQEIKDRQVSLKAFASEIKTDLCIEKKDGKWTLGSFKDAKSGEPVTFEKVVLDNPDYFKAIVDGEKPVHLREPKHKSSKHFLSRLVKESAAEILGTELAKPSYVDKLLESRANQAGASRVK